MMELQHWIIGPQLIGVIFIITGFIQKRFPPRKINAFYGYRMPSAMKSQQTWDEANRYAARYMMRSGVMLTIGGVMITAFLGLLNLDEDTYMMINAMLLIPSAIGSCVMLVVSTEKHLSRTFDNNI
ncbi:SdpI family protein [Mucilaginibacter sp. UR6-1]|uniref:SdpI family protein n=1 Tax=Mucilaginibacter sp. UR6-1 TaxID=1435643 RepID=UPI001E61FA25|nr:SdpI family protein [Mucilaginibacter sp. UR6-1]MCC8410574.1 SdpI family protein [Mucilaginibacter sp. UR6-1]